MQMTSQGTCLKNEVERTVGVVIGELYRHRPEAHSTVVVWPWENDWMSEKVIWKGRGWSEGLTGIVAVACSHFADPTGRKETVLRNSWIRIKDCVTTIHQILIDRVSILRKEMIVTSRAHPIAPTPFLCVARRFSDFVAETKWLLTLFESINMEKKSVKFPFLHPFYKHHFCPFKSIFSSPNTFQLIHKKANKYLCIVCAAFGPERRYTQE